jgi:hypothetical protein
MQFAYKPSYATSVPTTSEMHKVLTFNDIGLEPARGLRLETSRVRKTASITRDVAKWPAQAGVEPASSDSSNAESAVKSNK